VTKRPLNRAPAGCDSLFYWTEVYYDLLTGENCCTLMKVCVVGLETLLNRIEEHL
jgi:hypothetical protein